MYRVANIFILMFVFGLFGGAAAAMAGDRDDTSYITVGVGVYDYLETRDRQAEYRIEYRGQKLYGPLKPYVGVAGTLCPGEYIGACTGKNTTGSFILGGGALIDYKLSDNVFLTPSLGLAFYHGGNRDLDLDSPLIGRAQIELGYRFDDNSRLSFAISHYDNMGIGKTNPGTETFTTYVSFPID